MPTPRRRPTPTGLTATASGSSQVGLSWTASTDNAGVAGYRVERCQGTGCTNFAQVGTPTATTFSDTGLAPSSTYRYRVRAIDASGNLSGYSTVAEATTGAAPATPPGLVGAWAFAEGNGTTTADSSGNGNAGTITGASWTTQGRFGNALSFNGTNSLVRVADSASLDLTTAMTLSAWIQPTASQSGWRTIMQHETDAYFLNASNSDGPLRPSGGGTLGGNTQYLSGPSANPVNAWTYVALTYDGATVRLYINGTQVASRAATGAIQTTNSPLWIGGNSPYGEYFQGLIDEARVYNRALTQAEIQSDMNTSIVPTAPDTSPPTAPAGLTATASGSSQVNLNWTASTDNVGVAGYRVERCQGTGCTNFAQVGTPTATSYSDTGLAPSSTYRYQVRAVDASGNFSGYSAVASASTPAQSDTTPPSAPTGLSATAISSSRIDLGWTASTDNVGVAGYRVERCQGAGCTNFAQVAPPTGTTYSDTGLSPSTTYRYQVRAVDAAGNLSPYSVIATAITPAATDTTPPSAPTGLAATAVSASRIDLNWTAATDNVGGRRLPGRALPGHQLHQLRPGRDAHRHHLQQHGAPGKHQLPLPRASGRCRGEPESLLRHRDRSDPRQRHHATDRSYGAHSDGGGPDGDQYRLDGLNRQRRRHRLPGRALPGRGLHQLRPDRHAHCHHLRRHRPGALDHLPLPGPGGRRSRQPQHLLHCRHGDDAGRFGHHAPDRPDGVDGDRRRFQSGGAELDGIQRQCRRRRLPGRALPGRGLHQLRPDRHAHRHHLRRHRPGRPRPPTATGSGPSMPSGNLSGYSAVAQATTGAAPATPPGLVGAWAFAEGAGTTTADSSGNGNAGTLIGASWTTQGRYGNALSFNGTSSQVRVADSASLDLTTAMTLSAWIQPTASQSGWRTILQHETDAYFLNASNSDGPLRPSGGGTLGGNTQYLSGPSANPVNAWTNVAFTYDGATVRLYINGTQVASRATTGAIQTTNSPLWIGGNSPYGEYFQGLIDEARIYNRALTQAEIQSDMNAPVPPGS